MNADRVARRWLAETSELRAVPQACRSRSRSRCRSQRQVRAAGEMCRPRSSCMESEGEGKVSAIAPVARAEQNRVPWIAPENVDWWESEQRYLAAFEWLRENSPVYWHEADPSLHRPFWIVTRNEDGRTVLTNPDPFSSRESNRLDNELKVPQNRPKDPRFFANAFGAEDPPAALLLPYLFSRAFTARYVSQLEGKLRGYAGTLLHGVESGEIVDLIDVYAKPIPLFSITTLMGLERHM